VTRETTPGSAGWFSRWREDPILRRVVANSSWLLSARGINVPLGLLESILVTRLLGVQGFGILGIVITIITVINRLASFRMNDMVVKYLSESVARKQPGESAATLKAGLLAEGAASLVAFAVAVVAAPVTARLFLGGPENTHLILGYAFVILANSVVETTAGVLQVFNRFEIQAITNVLRKVVVLLGIGLSWALSAGLTGVLAAYVVSNWVASLYQLWQTIRVTRKELGDGWFRAPLALIRTRFREMARFALATNLGASLSLLVKESDLLWLAYFRTPVEAGYFKLATMLLKIPFAASSPLVSAVYPELARFAARRDVQGIRKLLASSTKLSATLLIPVCTLLVVTAPWLVGKFYGSEFLPAVPALYILLVGLALANLFFWTRPVLLALGQPFIPLRIGISTAVLKVALALLLVPRFGYLALAGILSGLFVLAIILFLVAIRSNLRRFESEEANPDAP
jgi:stage V sporulation protein B